MTFIDVLNNPEARRIVDAIEDTISSLRGYVNNHDAELKDVLASQVKELKALTGFTYVVEL